MIDQNLQSLAEDSYNSKFKQYVDSGKSERDSQKAAIHEAFADLLSCTVNNPKDIWSAIYSAHVKRRTGRFIDLTENEIADVISAHQSWIKSSGHAAEDFWKYECNKSLQGTNMMTFLQRDVSALHKSNQLANTGSQLSMLNDWLGSSSFDLYIGQLQANKNLIFGCIQSKTSIRDRVTREREPSNQAMDHKFWSIALVIDGDFLKLDKFEKMVNGGTEIYQRCGWHQMYVLHVAQERGRIIRLDKDFQKFRNDAERACDHFLSGGANFSTTFPL
jgi:hypothetical protein